MKRLQILIVEDDHVVARNLREAVEEMGHGAAGVVDDTEFPLRSFGKKDVDLADLDVRPSGPLTASPSDTGVPGTRTCRSSS